MRKSLIQFVMFFPVLLVLCVSGCQSHDDGKGTPPPTSATPAPPPEVSEGVTDKIDCGADQHRWTSDVDCDVTVEYWSSDPTKCKPYVVVQGKKTYGDGKSEEKPSSQTYTKVSQFSYGCEKAGEGGDGCSFKITSAIGTALKTASKEPTEVSDLDCEAASKKLSLTKGAYVTVQSTANPMGCRPKVNGTSLSGNVPVTVFAKDADVLFSCSKEGDSKTGCSIKYMAIRGK